MVRYTLDTQDGTLKMETKGEDPGSNEPEIRLMSLEEFKNQKGGFPYKKRLLAGLKDIHYCKVEMFCGCIQGTMKVPKKDLTGNEIFTFGFYMRADTLTIVEDGDMVRHIMDVCKSSHYGECSLHQFFLILFELLVEDDVLYLQQIEERLEKTEEAVLTGIPERFHENMVQYRRELFRFHSYYEQLTNIGDIMQMNMNRELTDQECMSWQHYTGRVERLHNTVEMLREYLLQVRELYQSQIDEQQNKTMGFLAVITALFLPLTLIAGWYGMNFKGMPELGSEHGYLAVVIAAVVIIIAEIIYFKKKRML